MLCWGKIDAPAYRMSAEVVMINRSLLSESAETIFEEIRPVLASNDVSLFRSNKRLVHDSDYVSGFTDLKSGLFLLRDLGRFKSYIIVGDKQCWNCGRFYGASGFARSFTTGDGLSHTCKKCIMRHDFLWGRGYNERRISRGGNILGIKKMPMPRFSGVAFSKGEI